MSRIVCEGLAAPGVSRCSDAGVQSARACVSVCGVACGYVCTPLTCQQTDRPRRDAIWLGPAAGGAAPARAGDVRPTGTASSINILCLHTPVVSRAETSVVCQ